MVKFATFMLACSEDVGVCFLPGNIMLASAWKINIRFLFSTYSRHFAIRPGGPGASSLCLNLPRVPHFRTMHLHLTSTGILPTQNMVKNKYKPLDFGHVSNLYLIILHTGTLLIELPSEQKHV
jgi:hypothetical protein